MPVEAGHIQITEYRKETIPYLNWMFEDLFCRYDVSIPYYLLDFSFPEYPLNAEWPEPYSPEWLALYKPSLPPFPEMLWPQLPEPEWPEMNWPALPKVLWPRLPDMPGLELPPWPEVDLPEFEIWWPDWEWPEWSLPESENTQWRGKRKRGGRGREWPTPWNPFKPEFQRTWPYETEWRGTTWYIPGKPESRRTWPYRTEWRGITWTDESDNLLKINQLLEIIADEAGVAVEQLSDLSPQSMAILNETITTLYEESPAVSADYTFNSQTKDGYLEKFGESQANPGSGTWTDAWNDIIAYTPDVYTASTRVSVLFSGRYKKTSGGTENWSAYKDRSYLSFDTSSLSGKTITAVTLKLYIEILAAIDDYETTRIVNVYTQAWDTLDANDWNGGTLVATFNESDLTVDGYYTITLTDTSTINKTGETQFEIAAKADVDGAVITDPTDLYVNPNVNYRRGGIGFGFASGDASTNKPVLTVTATG